MSTPVAPVPRNQWIAGSQPDCGIVISAPAVSGRHCRLVEYENGFLLEDLHSTNGTFVNGTRLAPGQGVWVGPSDVITLGANQPFPWPRPVAARRATEAQAGVWRRQITIGRAPENEQVLDYPMISWRHAMILEDQAGQLFLVDLGSANGTAIHSVGALIPPQQPVPIRREDEIYLGSLKLSVGKLTGNRRMTLGPAAAAQVSLRGAKMVIGRDPSADCPLDYPMISWRHAEITREGNAMFVTDLGSRNGTYLNGVRVTGRARLVPGAEIGLGSYRFTLLDSGDFARREDNGNVSIEAVAVTVDVGSHRLLNPVSLTILPGEMTAVMGPAGAGKTTFLKALNGYSAPSYGRVLFNGSDLYQHYDRFRLQLGYVPQDDIMHPLLTVEEALAYTARLRTDLTTAEIERRIQTVLTDLGIEDIAKRQIGSPEMKVISGGQRKRVNIAMELLSDPNVLFLDEPTSGLSSYDALQVVRLLRRLANEGKTIVLTIHQPSREIYKEFDNLIMVSRDRGGSTSGELAYFGPAYPDSIQYFNPGAADASLAPEQLLDGLAKRTTPEWAENYGRSAYRKRYVEERAGQLPAAPGAGARGAVRRFGFGQWLTLTGRTLRLRARDRGQAVSMAMQATAFPVLMVLVFGSLATDAGADAASWTKQCGNVATVHFLLVVAAIWFGVNNAARDVVGEWAIFQRERMVSLKLPSYVLAKVTVLGLINMAQCLVLLGIVWAACGLQAPFFEVYVALLFASQTGAALGLLISALSKTTESAIAFLPIPLLFMILLGGGIKPLHEMPPEADAISMAFPARWAFEANIQMEAERRPRMGGTADGADVAENVFPVKTGRAAGRQRNGLGTCVAILSVMWSGLLALVLGVLRRRDIH